MIKLTKTPILLNCQVAFFWYNCKFNPSNLEKKTLSLFQFLRFITGFKSQDLPFNGEDVGQKVIYKLMLSKIVINESLL